MLSSATSLALYFVVLISSVILMAYGGAKKGRGFFLALGLMLVTLLGALRFSVGTDFSTYLGGFNTIIDLNPQQFLNDFSDIYEPGIYILTKVSAIFGNSYQLFFGLFTFLTVLFTYLGVRKYRVPSVWIALILYLLILFPSSFNIMRQMLAVAIFFYASAFIFDKKILKYALLVGLAALFHKSAIILLPLYFIGKLVKKNSKINTRAAVFMIGGMVVALLVGPYLISAILGLPIFQKYDKYQTVSDASTGVVLIAKTLLLGLIAVLYKHIKQYPYVAFFIVMSVLELIITFVARNSVDISRFAAYFSMFPLMLLTYLPLAFKGKSRLVISLLVLIYAILMFYITFFVAGGSEIFPYNFSLVGAIS